MTLFSKKARYALHGLAYLAACSEERPVPFGRILGYLRAYSNRLSLSPAYIAKVFQEASRAGLVVAVSGPRGGYQLARPANRIRLIEVVEAMDGPLREGCCLLSAGTCDRQGSCGVGGLLREAESSLYDFFERETVASLARRMEFPDAATIRSLEPRGRRARRA